MRRFGNKLSVLSFSYNGSRNNSFSLLSVISRTRWTENCFLESTIMYYKDIKKSVLGQRTVRVDTFSNPLRLKYNRRNKSLFFGTQVNYKKFFPFFIYKPLSTVRRRIWKPDYHNLYT